MTDTPAEPYAIQDLRRYADKPGYLNAKQIIAHIDDLTSQISTLTARLEQIYLMYPHLAAAQGITKEDDDGNA